MCRREFIEVLAIEQTICVLTQVVNLKIGRIIFQRFQNEAGVRIELIYIY